MQTSKYATFSNLARSLEIFVRRRDRQTSFGELHKGSMLGAVGNNNNDIERELRSSQYYYYLHLLGCSNSTQQQQQLYTKTLHHYCN